MEEYLVSVAIKKGIYALIKGIVAYVLSDQALKMEARWGIHIDPQTFQAEVGSFLFAAEHMAHDWLKMKFPNVKWL